MSETRLTPDLEAALEAALAGGPERHHAKTAEQGKLPVRERVARLVDPESFAEEALLANWDQEGLGADGVVTGLATVGGRTVALMANDPTVKAGLVGPEDGREDPPDPGAGAEPRAADDLPGRLGRRPDHRPGADVPRPARRGADLPQRGAAVRAGCRRSACSSGRRPPGGAYIPAFCDVVIMREGNASMYLGSPRMAEMVIGEKVTLEEMGGAKMHTGVSGLRPLPGEDATRTRSTSRGATSPTCRRAGARRRRPRRRPTRTRSERSPRSSRRTRRPPFDVKELIGALVDADSFCEVQERWAKELVTGYARLDGRVVGIVANQPKFKGGVLFVDSADKAARFIWTCNAFNVPLLFLADVPGFMIGTEVERQGIIRHGAKMISAVSEATVPKLSVIVRKAYGAGLYAMAGPAFEPDCCIALPTASIAVMGPEAAINAVFFNQIQAIDDEAEREEFVERKRDEYSADIDILHLASELVVDAVIEPDDLRAELIRRFALAETEGPALLRAPQPGHARLEAVLPDSQARALPFGHASGRQIPGRGGTCLRAGPRPAPGGRVLGRAAAAGRRHRPQRARGAPGAGRHAGPRRRSSTRPTRCPWR